MIEASIDILDRSIIKKCDSLAIIVKTLNNSKRNTIAFNRNYRRRREFEIKCMKNGIYHVSTRFIGYKNVMKKYSGSVLKKEDPDGRRYSFTVALFNEKELNELIGNMLEDGYDPDPKVELIY